MNPIKKLRIVKMFSTMFSVTLSITKSDKLASYSSFIWL
jgi:hypothetical protein